MTGLVSNIITTLFSRVVVLVFALISSIILARVLGPEGRGLFALVLLMPELARTFGLVGFEQANAVYAGLEPASRRALVWHSAGLAAIMGGVIAVAMMGYIILGAPGFPALAQGPLGMYLIALSIVPAALATEYWGAILRGMNRIFLANMLDMGLKVASVGLLVALLLWLRLGVLGAVLTDFAINIGTVVIMGVLLRHLGILGRPSFDASLWKRTVKFACPAYCATLMSYLNYRVDQLIIAVLLPPEQLGFYVIAVALGERLWILTGAVSNALLPHLTNSKERDPAISAVIARHVAIWTGAGCVVVFLLADRIIQVMYSSAFSEVAAPLRWLLPGILMASVGKIVLAELLAREKVYYMVWMTGITALINIVGNVLLIPVMGISGAALASSVSYAVLSIMMTFYYLSETGVSLSTLIPRRTDLLTYTALWHRSNPPKPIQSKMPHHLQS
jgi:stage V sporulation protein B